MVASVATNEGNPTRVVVHPLTNPSPVAAARPMSKAKICGTPATPNSIDAITPVIIATAAMLRSISPQSRTKVTPVATTANVATWARMLRRLTKFKKLSVVTLKKSTNRTRVANGAKFRARRRIQLATAGQGTARFSVAAISFTAACSSCWVKVDAEDASFRSGVFHEVLFGQDGAAELRGDVTLSHHQSTVGDAEDRLRFGGDEQNCDTFVS